MTLVSHAAGAPARASGAAPANPQLSADGSVVVFRSAATDLVAGFADTNGGGASDAYLFERATGSVTLVSHAHGAPATGASQGVFTPRVSADGRFVLLRSAATNLVQGFDDANGLANSDVLLHDRQADVTVLVSHAVNAPTTTANGHSQNGRISGDGRVVVFDSYARNLVLGFVDGNGGGAEDTDVFLWDRETGESILVSRAGGSATHGADKGSSAAGLSHDGRFVMFVSAATDLVAPFSDPSGTGARNRVPAGTTTPPAA